MIMARGFTSNLATPAFLVDGEGDMIFFNDAAGDLLGVRFEEAGSMNSHEWGTRFAPTTLEGQPLDAEQLPLSMALSDSRPVHSPMRIRSAHGDAHEIEVTAFPVMGRDGQRGAIAFFWDRCA
jgi:PAS domain-containing protein